MHFCDLGNLSWLFVDRDEQRELWGCEVKKVLRRDSCYFDSTSAAAASTTILQYLRNSLL